MPGPFSFKLVAQGPGTRDTASTRSQAAQLANDAAIWGPADTTSIISGLAEVRVPARDPHWCRYTKTGQLSLARGLLVAWGTLLAIMAAPLALGSVGSRCQFQWPVHPMGCQCVRRPGL
jgi:hypothetical protein